MRWSSGGGARRRHERAAGLAAAVAVAGRDEGQMGSGPTLLKRGRSNLGRGSAARHGELGLPRESGEGTAGRGGEGGVQRAGWAFSPVQSGNFSFYKINSAEK